MIRKIITIIFVLLSLYLISNRFTFTVQAQPVMLQGGPPAGDDGQAPAPQMWRCLKAEQEGGRTRIPPPEVNVILTGYGFPPKQDIYIVLCAAPTADRGGPRDNYNCTTGNSKYDRLIFGSDMTKSIDPLAFQVPLGSIPNSTIQTNYGKVDIKAHVTNAHGHRNYAFFGVTIDEPKIVATDSAATIQYATFRFAQDPMNCISIRWDPYGRVFDSQSLEPIKGVNVSLLNERKQLVIQRGLINPQKTETDGVFNFFVAIKEGGTRTFLLNPVPLPPLTHTFTATPNLHPNYSKAYYDIYKPDELIVEAAGNPEHRDIPLDPGENAPFTSAPVSITKSSVKIGKFIRFEGTISHPLSIVTLVGKNSGKEIARVNADKNGDWEILIPIKSIPPNEALKIVIIKVDITTLSRNSKNNSLAKSILQYLLDMFGRPFNVSAQVTDQTAASDEFQPITTYIEGYARDKNGDTLPNARVNIKLEMSDGVYFQTTTDETGYFYISPDNLPVFTYYLEFLVPNSTEVVKIYPAEFAQENEQYLSENNINLMAGTRKGQSLIPTTPSTPTPISANPQGVQSTSSRDQLNMILTVVILIFLLGIVGGVLLYIKKKEAQSGNLS